MPDEKKTTDERAAELGKIIKEADAKRRADEAGANDKFDKILAALEAVSTRMDGLEAKVEKKAADGDEDVDREDKPGVMNRDGTMPGAPVGRNDAQEMAEKAALGSAQMRCDAVAVAHSERAPPPMMGERADQYRRRLLRGYQRFSKEFRDVDLETVSGKVLDAIETRIYADARTASINPIVPAGVLHERLTTDASGRQIRTFYGEPRVWMDQFSSAPYRLTAINLRPRD